MPKHWRSARSVSRLLLPGSRRYWQSSARSRRAGRPQAGVTTQGEHSRYHQAYSRKCRPAAAIRRGPHRPVTPGSHRRRASLQRPHHDATRTVYIRQATSTAEKSASSLVAETSVISLASLVGADLTAKQDIHQCNYGQTEREVRNMLRCAGLRRYIQRTHVKTRAVAGPVRSDKRRSQTGAA